MEFLRQIFREEKIALMQPQVKQVYVPCWPELAPKYIWAQALDHPEFLSYMPDSWGPDSKLLERGYFYGVLCTLAPYFVQQLIKVCRDQRAEEVVNTRAKKPLKDVQISETWMNKLLSEGFVSSKYFFPTHPL